MNGMGGERKFLLQKLPGGRTPEPIMPSQLPKVKLDMRETVKYARPPCETGL